MAGRIEVSTVVTLHFLFFLLLPLVSPTPFPNFI